MRELYADNAATTALSPAVLEAMLPVLRENWGNPSSQHSRGQQAKAALEDARRRLAACLNAKPGELLFTSGGTESDNWALRGAAALGAKAGKRHLVVSAIEHHAVLRCAQALEGEGFSVTYVNPDRGGVVSPEAVVAALREDSCLVSVMAVNNELGTAQPIGEIGRLCRERGVLFHTDAVQAAGRIELDLCQLDVDLLSLSAHKLHGPKGVGALFLRQGLELPALLAGGGQERGKRGGTENLAGAVGLAVAMELACRDRARNQARLAQAEHRLLAALSDLDGLHTVGDQTRRVPGILSLLADGVESEALLLALDLRGVRVSAGAACSSGSLEPSHVLRAIGLSPEQARSVIRISLSPDATDDDADYLAQTLREMVGFFAAQRA